MNDEEIQREIIFIFLKNSEIVITENDQEHYLINEEQFSKIFGELKELCKTLQK